MNRAIFTLAALALLALVVLPAQAISDQRMVWDLRGDYVIDFICSAGCGGHEGSHHPHSMTIDEMTLRNGQFSGHGFFIDRPGFVWETRGKVSKNKVKFEIIYTVADAGYTVKVKGAIADDGVISGKAKSSNGEWFDLVTVSGAAKKVPKWPHPSPTPTPTLTPSPTPTPIPSPSPTPTGNCSSYVNDSQPVVVDDFNGYSDGSIVGQGSWQNYVNGSNFVVQGAVVNEGAKALHNNTFGDSVATKPGTPRADGKQAVCVRTENRSTWGFYVDGNAQFRVTKNSWAGGTDVFAAVTFKTDGNVAYFDPTSGVYQNFATYTDNEWTLLEIEWRSSDKTARYRVNSGPWTDWKTFKGAASFTDFDYVGFDFFLPSGAGGVYFDTLR